MIVGGPVFSWRYWPYFELALTAHGTEGASLVPAIGLSALGAFDTVAESALSLDAVTRFTGQKPLLPFCNPFFHWAEVKKMDGRIVNSRTISIALTVSGLCAIALLVYGLQRLGPFADQATVAAVVIALGDNLALSLLRRRTKANPNPEGARKGKMVIHLNRASLTYILAVALLGLVLLALGFIFPGPASLVWSLSGAVMLFLVVVMIVRIRKHS